jgi:trigger factor
MKVELTDVSQVKKKLEIEVDTDAVERETRSVVQAFRKQARVPGFRKGKTPPEVVRKRFAKEIDDEVRDHLLSHSYHDALKEKELEPIGDPIVDEVDFKPGESLRYAVTVEVAPQFELKNHRGVEVRREPPLVTEDDVDKALDEIRESRTQLVSVSRAAATGDFLVADVAGEPDGDGAEPFRREKTLLEVGATDNLPQFNEHLEGAEAGGRLEFSVEYPEEYPAKQLAGRSVAYGIDVVEVKERQVPELDDEFAKDLGDFDDLPALRARVREDLEQRAKARSEAALREAVLDKVLLENTIPLPDVLVEAEVKHRLEDMVRSMVMQGMDPRSMELDWKELRDRQEEPARKSVHARLVLDRVAKEESIEVEDSEIKDRVRAEAARMGEKYETVRGKLQKSGGWQALRGQLLREKSLDLLTSVANIQVEEK